MEKEEEDDFVVKVDLSDEDVSKEEGGRRLLVVCV